jgi:UDP-glucose-4-epimerase GalE
MVKVLVTGGAGYIGSHVLKALRDAGHRTAAYDSLIRGHRKAVVAGEFHQGELADRDRLREVIASFRPEAAIHLAALASVPESVAHPSLYYRQNVEGSLTLLEELARVGVGPFVFSSSAAVYGTPEQVPISETAAPRPINPYGETKLAVERMLHWMAGPHGFRAVSLRYFNACGCDPAGEIGEDHDPETHLIPLVYLAAAGRRGQMTVYGDDYDTPDGSCVRDYIHVSDLADAHVLAVESLVVAGGQSGLRGPGHQVFNLGTELGFSVFEVIRAVEKVLGRPVPFQVGPRRAGDPPVLVASSAKARVELGWRPTRSDLETIIGSGWAWHEAHPQGYSE